MIATAFGEQNHRGSAPQKRGKRFVQIHKNLIKESCLTFFSFQNKKMGEKMKTAFQRK